MKLKLCKQEKEDKVIKEFEKDCIDYLDIRRNCGLDLGMSKCKKCDFVTHSEGILRKHKVNIHKIKESNENIILGFKSDFQSYCELLETMDEEPEEVKCKECEFKITSRGKLQIHMNETH